MARPRTIAAALAIALAGAAAPSLLAHRPGTRPASALASPTGPLAAPDSSGQVIAVDGDTLRFVATDERIRIIGLDAPETYFARCDAERQAGYAAADVLRELIASGPVVIERRGLDKYHRTLARVTVNGRDVAEMMIRTDNAVAYVCPNGHCPRRIDWCQKITAEAVRR